MREGPRGTADWIVPASLSLLITVQFGLLVLGITEAPAVIGISICGVAFLQTVFSLFLSIGPLHHPLSSQLSYIDFMSLIFFCYGMSGPISVPGLHHYIREFRLSSVNLRDAGMGDSIDPTKFRLVIDSHGEKRFRYDEVEKLFTERELDAAMAAWKRGQHARVKSLPDYAADGGPAQTGYSVQPPFSAVKGPRDAQASIQQASLPQPTRGRVVDAPLLVSVIGAVVLTAAIWTLVRPVQLTKEVGPFAALSVSLDDAWGAAWSSESLSDASNRATTTCKSRAREPNSCEASIAKGAFCIAMVKTPPDLMAVMVDGKKDKRSFGVRVGAGATSRQAVLAALTGSEYGIAQLEMNISALKALICADKPNAVSKNVNW